MRKKIVADILLISVVLFTAFAAQFFWQGGGEGVWVVAEQDGREILRVPLAQDGDYLLSDEEYGRNMLRIENGAVRVLEETEAFFRSDYFRRLTGLSGEAVLRMIRKEMENG